MFPFKCSILQCDFVIRLFKKFLAIPYTAKEELGFLAPCCINMSDWLPLSPELYEQPRDKTNSVAVRPAKTQISLGIRPV